MEKLVRLAVAAALTLSLGLLCSARAQNTSYKPYKFNCYSSDRSTQLQGNINSEAPVTQLTNLIVVDQKTIFTPTLAAKTFTFSIDTSSIQFNGILPNKEKLNFSARPSVADPKIWTGTVEIKGKIIPVSCDLL